LVERRRQEERFAKRMLEVRARTLEALGETDAASFPLAILPFNGHRVVNLQEWRRRAFRDRLNRLLSKAARQAASRGAEPAPPRAQPDASARQLAVLAAGCAACMGHCCTQGKGHAFLDVETLRRYMAEHPQARPRDVFEAYLSHLPSRTYLESCEYHAERGCALPRHMRARMCNEFYCGGLLGLRKGLAEVKTTRGFAVATADQKVIRTVIIDESGVRDVPSAGLG
jgi:hypothetical protein